jgi:hypothetical protein
VDNLCLQMAWSNFSSCERFYLLFVHWSSWAKTWRKTHLKYLCLYVPIFTHIYSWSNLGFNKVKKSAWEILNLILLVNTNTKCFTWSRESNRHKFSINTLEKSWCQCLQYASIICHDMFTFILPYFFVLSLLDNMLF